MRDNCGKAARVALDLVERAIFLRRTVIGRALPDPALRSIAEVAREVTFGAGEVIAFEEDVGDEMFLVVSGRVEVRQLGRPPPERAARDALGVVVGHFEPDAVLGEMAVLDDQRRSASMIAETAVVALAVHREDLRDAIAVCPDLAFGLFHVLAARIRKADEERIGARASSLAGRDA
jgi:CRP/FNR family transcriptional regulator, cyclic AMP receptor protein